MFSEVCFSARFVELYMTISLVHFVRGKPGKHVIELIDTVTD